MIKITLPNGDIREYNEGVTPIEIAKDISPSLAKSTYAVKVDGKPAPIKGAISADSSIELITDEAEAKEFIYRTSARGLAQVLKAEGILTKVNKCEAEEDGFVLDFDANESVSDKIFAELEKKVIKHLSKVDANEKFCTIPSKVKFIKLRGVGGTAEGGFRIFGFSASSKEIFEELEVHYADRDSRDHRRIGTEMELFFFDQEAARGFPFWLPNGKILKDTIADWIKKQELKYGSQRIQTPVIGQKHLYETSGHYYHYKDGMFPEMTFTQEESNETALIRPMACPHHVIVYKHKPRSYRDLPVRLSEDVLQYRYEHSGALIGLERVRGMELTDSHVFLRPDQLEQEISTGFEIIMTTLEKFNIEIDYIELACHDPENSEKYHGNPEMWAKSEALLEKFLIDKGVKYKKMIGEAAFYGPKIDVQIKTANGHNITVSTIQLDYLLPERFDIDFTNAEGEKERPVMIHRGHIGTYERFISVLLEQTKGDLPMWLAPRQAVVIPVSEEHHGEYAQEVFSQLIDNDVKAELDASGDRLGNKIRKYQTAKVKTQIIIGDEEVKNRTVSYRYFGSEETHTVKLDEILAIYKDNA